jgi:hypothetical protein
LPQRLALSGSEQQRLALLDSEQRWVAETPVLSVWAAVW